MGACRILSFSNSFFLTFFLQLVRLDIPFAIHIASPWESELGPFHLQGKDT